MLYDPHKINAIHNQISKLQNEIKKLIGVLNHEEASNKFSELIDIMTTLGKYNKSTWLVKNTQKWWLFFEFLGDYEFVTSYLMMVENKITNCDLSEIEALEFIRIELLCGLTKDHKMLKENIGKLLTEYPYNLEFSHTAAHLLIDDESSRFEAIRLYRKCIDGWGTQYAKLITDLYNIEINVFREAFESGDYLEADKKLDYVIKYNYYRNNPILNNTSLSHRERLKDRKFTEATASKIERELKSALHDESELQNKKNIEQLGVFSAIITFIITAAASAFSSNQSMAPLILISIGLILILFITTISLLHFKPDSLFKDFRFYLLALFSCLTIYTVHSTSLTPVVDGQALESIELASMATPTNPVIIELETQENKAEINTIQGEIELIQNLDEVSDKAISASLPSGK